MRREEPPVGGTSQAGEATPSVTRPGRGVDSSTVASETVGARWITLELDDVDAIARALAYHLTPTRLDDLTRRLVRECQSRDTPTACTR